MPPGNVAFLFALPVLMEERGKIWSTSSHQADSSLQVPLTKCTLSGAVIATEKGLPVTSSARATSITLFMSMHACKSKG